MSKTITGVTIIVVVIIGGYFLFLGEDQTAQESNTQTPSLGVPAPGFESVPETVVIPNGAETVVTASENGSELPKEGSVISEPIVREISMTSGNVFFSPKNLTITKNQPVKLSFRNTGSHTFTIDKLGVNTSLRGSSPTVEFTPTQSGTFEYYCAVPGHREGGMSGSLSVE